MAHNGRAYPRLAERDCVGDLGSEVVSQKPCRAAWAHGIANVAAAGFQPGYGVTANPAPMNFPPPLDEPAGLAKPWPLPPEKRKEAGHYSGLNENKRS